MAHKTIALTTELRELYLKGEGLMGSDKKTVLLVDIFLLATRGVLSR